MGLGNAESKGRLKWLVGKVEWSTVYDEAKEQVKNKPLGYVKGTEDYRTGQDWG